MYHSMLDINLTYSVTVLIEMDYLQWYSLYYFLK